MITPVPTPRLNANDDHLTLTAHLVPLGAPVRRGDPIARVETAKTSADVEAPCDGLLRAFAAEPGQRLAIGQPLAFIADTLHEPLPDPPPRPNTDDHPRATRAALKLAQLHGIDLDALDHPGILKVADLLPLIPTPFLPEGFPSTLLPHHAVLLGAGGHANALRDLVAQARPDLTLVGALDDHLPPGDTLQQLTVLGPSSLLPDLYKRGLRVALLGVGAGNQPAHRIPLYQRLRDAGMEVPALIHPAASVEPSAHIHPGAQIFAGALIGACAVIGENALINTGAIVSHDCHINPHAHLAPGAILGGGVTIGEAALIGMGATVYLGVTIGPGVTLRNGTHTFTDLPPR